MTPSVDARIVHARWLEVWGDYARMGPFQRALFWSIICAALTGRAALAGSVLAGRLVLKAFRGLVMIVWFVLCLFVVMA